MKEHLRYADDGLETLATNTPQFHKLGRIKFDYSRIADKNDKNLLSILKNYRASYRHSQDSLVD